MDIQQSRAADQLAAVNLPDIKSPTDAIQKFLQSLPAPIGNAIQNFAQTGQDAVGKATGVQVDLTHPETLVTNLNGKLNDAGGVLMRFVKFLADFVVTILTGIVEIVQNLLGHL
jgi:hypothetical protein